MQAEATHHADQHLALWLVSSPEALASVSTGCSSKNTCYWGEMGSTCPEEERESLL